MRLPSSRLQTIVLIVYYSLLVRLRGLRFRERTKAQITAADVTRMDTCWSLAMVLGFVDTYVGLIFQRRAASGFGRRRSRSHHACGGDGRGFQRDRGRPSLATHFSAASSHAGSGEPKRHRTGTRYAAAAPGLATLFNGHFREAAEHFARTLEILEDGSTGLVHERVSSLLFSMDALAYLGRFKQLRRSQQDGLRDAHARGDPLRRGQYANW